MSAGELARSIVFIGALTKPPPMRLSSCLMKLVRVGLLVPRTRGLARTAVFLEASPVLPSRGLCRRCQSLEPQSSESFS